MNIEKRLLHIKLIAITSVLTVNATICVTQILFILLHYNSDRNNQEATVQDVLNKKIQKSSIQLLIVLLLDILVVVLSILKEKIKKNHILDKFLVVLCIANSTSMWPVFDQGQIEVVLQVNFLIGIFAPLLISQSIAQIIIIHLLLSLNNLGRRLYFIENAKIIDTSVLFIFGLAFTAVGILITIPIKKL